MAEPAGVAHISVEPNPSRYDPTSHTIFIGAASAPDANGAPLIEVSRAADLVGRPLHLVPSQGAIRTSLGAASIPTGLPVRATALTSGFGMREHPILGGWREHSGIDLAASMGSPIVATSDGIVTKADWVGGYGLLVALEHGGGVQTRYGHMSRLNVYEGEHVHKGDVIGYVGSTGRSTGPHLHYEVRVNGAAVNPLPLLRSGH